MLRNYQRMYVSKGNEKIKAGTTIKKERTLHNGDVVYHGFDNLNGEIKTLINKPLKFTNEKRTEQVNNIKNLFK